MLKLLEHFLFFFISIFFFLILFVYGFCIYLFFFSLTLPSIDISHGLGTYFLVLHSSISTSYYILCFSLFAFFLFILFDSTVSVALFDFILLYSLCLSLLFLLTGMVWGSYSWGVSNFFEFRYFFLLFIILTNLFFYFLFKRQSNFFVFYSWLFFIFLHIVFFFFIVDNGIHQSSKSINTFLILIDNYNFIIIVIFIFFFAFCFYFLLSISFFYNHYYSYLKDLIYI